MTRGGDAPHAHRARTRPAWTTRLGWRVLRARRPAPPGGAPPAPGARCPRRRLVLGLLVLAAVVSTRWVRLNVSPSVPRGLYRLMAVAPPVPRHPGLGPGAGGGATLVVLLGARPEAGRGGGR